MNANLEAKKQVVSDIVEKLKNAECMMVVSYSGLTVEQVTELRKQCRENDVHYCVYKNRLMNRALQELNIEGLGDLLEGPNAFVFSEKDVTAGPKILSTFIEKNKLTSLTIKGGLMGTEVIFVDTDDYEDIYREMDRIGTELGVAYYKIPCGGSNALGSLGYVDCAREISRQQTHFDAIVCSEGSGGTVAGLALGAKLFLPGTEVYGMMVDTDPFDEITPTLMREAAALLGAETEIGVQDFHLRDMCGPGYAIPSEEGNAAISLLAKEEGLFLDPVYTGKAFAGLIQMAEEGCFQATDNVLFLHTGGAGGLFAVL